MNKIKSRNSKARERARLKNKKKRRKYHKRKYIAYYMIFLLIVISTAVFLSLTVFFKIEHVNITLETTCPYSEEEVASVCNLKEGDNLILTSKRKIKNKILDNFLEIDDVKVSKIFPSKISINCNHAKIKFCCEKSDGTFLYISEKNKILKDSEEDLPSDDVLVLKCFTNCFDDCKSGEYLKIPEKEDKKFTIIKNKILEVGLEKITKIELINSDSANLQYDNDILIEIDNFKDLSYLIESSAKILKNYIEPGQSGVLMFCKRDKTIHFVPND